MRSGMASSATRRRLSREPVTSPLSTGGSSDTALADFPAMTIFDTRSGSGGAFDAAFRTGGSANDTCTARPANSPPRGTKATVRPSTANSPGFETRLRSA